MPMKTGRPEDSIFLSLKGEGRLKAISRLNRVEVGFNIITLRAFRKRTFRNVGLGRTEVNENCSSRHTVWSYHVIRRRA